MTRQELIQKEELARKEWEAITKIDGYTIAELRRISDAIFDSQDWKNAWTADIPHSLVEAAIRATEYFHGNRPEILGIVPLSGKVRIAGKGYQA